VQLLPQRLAPKLNLSLLVFFLLLGTATGALVFFGFRRTQDNATSLSRQGLELQGSETLKRLADQTSFSGQLIVQQATTDSAAAANYLARAHQLGASVPWEPARLQAAASGALVDPSSSRVTDVWVPATAQLNDDLRANLTDSATLDALFPTLLRGNPDAVGIYYITPQGASRSYPPFGSRNALAADFDPFGQRGFEEFRSGVTAPTRPLWTAPYESPGGQGLIISALSPVYEDGEYRGVVGIDLAVSRLIARVDEVRYTPGGYAFVIDRDGDLMPSQYSAQVQAMLDNAENTAFASTIQAMRDGKAGFDRVDGGDSDVIVAYAPLGDLGGSLALVSPVDELTAQAAAVTSSIDREGDRTLAFILATMLGFFAAGVAAVAWFNRRLLTNPVQSLVTGTRAVAAGNYSVRIAIRSTDELGMLADSFNLMIEQIDMGQQRLEQRNVELQAQIAERERIEQELRRSEDLYRTLTRNFPNGTVVLYDRDLRFQIVDGQGITSLGLTKADVEGKRLDELFTARVRERLEPQMKAVFAGETRVFEIGAANRIFVAYTLPLWNEEGEIFAGMAMTQDITERKQAEVDLAEREAQYRSIFESVSDGLIITDVDANVVEVNAALAAMHGYSREEMMQVHPQEFIHADSHHLFEEYNRTIAAGGTYRSRATDVRKDGSEFPVEVFGRPVMYRGTRHVLGVVRDITEQVETERLLEQRVEERTREIAALLDISHAVTGTLELRALVAVILQELKQIVEYNGASVLLREGDELAILEFDDNAAGQRSTTQRQRFSLAMAAPIWERVQQQEAVTIGDIYGEDVLATAFRRTVGSRLETSFPYVRAALFVPLALQDDVIGMLAISHGEAGYFTDHNAALVMAVANHAAVAISNARLFERVEQRTRELSTLLDLSHSVASTLSLNQLVPIILESMRKVTSYMGASILLREGDELAIVTFDPAIDTTAPRQSALRFKLNEPGAIWQHMLRHEPAIIDDVRDDSLLAQSFRETVGGSITDATFDLVNSLLIVPLISQGTVTGMIALSHVENGFFRQQDASLAMTVANQAAIAIQNARLFESVEQRTRELSTLLDVSHDVTSTLELDPLLNLILDQVQTVADYDRASVMLVEKNELVVAAVKSIGARMGQFGYPPGARFPIDLDGGAWRRLSSGKPIVIANVQSDDADAVGYRQSIGVDVSEVDFQAWMAVPLVHQDRVVGMLALGKHGAGYYTARHGQLAAAIANQAAVAVENARLYANSANQTRELSTLLDVSHAVASTLDLRALLRVILEQSRNVLDYDRASVTLSDGAQLTVFSVLNADGDEFRSYTPPGTSFEKASAGILWKALSGGQYIIIDDVLGDSANAIAYRELIPVDRANPDFRSWLAVPLASQDGVSGLLAFTQSEIGHYTERHARLAMAIANQAAVAVENARLFASVEQRTRELSALLDVSHSVAATLDLRELVGLILDQLKLVAEYTGSSLLRLEGGDLVILESRGPFGPESNIAGLRFPLATVQEWWAQLSRGRDIIIGDVRGDSPEAAAYRRAVGRNIEHPAFAYVRSWMAVPLMLQDRPVGVLSVSRDDTDYFTLDHVRIARAVADQAAIAIENARLYEQAQQLAAVEERQRLARELHDSVSQALYGIALGARTARTLLDRDAAKAVEPVEYVLQLAEAGLAEMRALIFELRPESLENEGLVAAIEKQVSATRARYGVNVMAALCEEPVASMEVKEAIFRVVQESLHNIVKHAHASRVDVELAWDDAEIRLAVRDDGVGFDADGSFPGHMGLKSMRERTLKLGGMTTIESARGEGTLITVRVPQESASGRRPAPSPA